jgi:hypothetical protein
VGAPEVQFLVLGIPLDRLRAARRLGDSGFGA